MKQNITKEQLLDLRPLLDKDKENEFWRYSLEKYDICVDNTSDEDISEQFTIGKLLEILANFNFQYFDIRYLSNDPNKNLAKSRKVSLSVYEIAGNPIFKEFFNEEMCDALWDAFKYSLTLD
jgi:hypothetical protein